MAHFKKHFLSYIVTILTILVVATSYYRFMVTQDYTVSYEGDCNPYTESCFVYCEDDECAEPFYFSIIERQAAEIYDRCGGDVTLCDKAYECQPEVPNCSITFCDPILDGDECDTLTEADFVPDSNDTSL